MSTPFLNDNPTAKREKILLALAGVLAVVVLLPMLYSLYGGASSTIYVRRDKLREDVNDLVQKVKKEEAYKKRLDDYTKRSLPPLAELATLQYRKWLLDHAAKSGFQNPRASLTTAIKTDKSAGFRNYSFKLEGSASLAALTSFLHEFYEVDHLHLIKTLSVKPVQQSKTMEISMVIESLALDEAKQSKEIEMNLNDSPGFAALLREQVRTVDERGIFSPYRPPAVEGAPQSPPPGLKDYTEANFTYVTSIVEVDGVYEVWIQRRLKGDCLKLKVGDKFEVGGYPCMIKDIDFHKTTVEVIVDGESSDFVYRVGKNFDQPD